MNEKYLVSVIVPIYNASLYLDKCIGSIVSQSYTRLQIILVDDGSTDECYEKCERYAAKDRRIITVHKENGGLVSARKTGISLATGEYVCWVDADDWIEQNYIEQFVELQIKYNVDVVALSHYHDIGYKSTLVKNGIPQGKYKIRDILGSMIYCNRFFEYGVAPHLVTKMFKTKIIRIAELCVDETIIAGEDAAATYPALLNCNDIYISNQSGYHYVQHAGTLTKCTNIDEVSRVLRLIQYLKDCFVENGEEILISQLEVYRNYMLVMRKIDYFDKVEDSILSPFGGIKKDNRIIIYGAGVMGKRIHDYLVNDKKITITMWIDKNYIEYQKRGMDVISPLYIKQCEYDYVIIANITESVAIEIFEYLISLGVDKEKIRWFTSDFTGKN